MVQCVRDVVRKSSQIYKSCDVSVQVLFGVWPNGQEGYRSSILRAASIDLVGVKGLSVWPLIRRQLRVLIFLWKVGMKSMPLDCTHVWLVVWNIFYFSIYWE